MYVAVQLDAAGGSERCGSDCGRSGSYENPNACTIELQTCCTSHKMQLEAMSDVQVIADAIVVRKP
jgi:hypothetical protein